MNTRPANQDNEAASNDATKHSFASAGDHDSVPDPPAPPIDDGGLKAFSIQKLKELRLTPAITAVAGRTGPYTVPITKPPRQRFIRCHREHRFETQVLIEKDGDRRTYLIDRSLWDDLAGELTPVSLVQTISRQGTVFLWPVTIPDESGRTNRWSESAYQASIVAVEKWIRLSANMEAGFYDVIEAPPGLSEPVWPDVPFEKLIEVAFRGNFISSWEHIVLRQLRGEV